MKQVFIKVYGWVDVIEQNGDYSLLLFESGAKICYRTLGCEFRKTDPQTKLKL